MKRVAQTDNEGPQATVSDALERWFSAGFAASNPEVLDTVRTWILRDGRSSRTWQHELVREDGQVIARAEVVSVLVRDERPASLPEVYRRLFARFDEDAAKK